MFIQKGYQRDNLSVHLVNNIMNSFDPKPVRNTRDNNIDASEINKTDKNGAFTDKDGKSKNYKGGKDAVNGPNFNRDSEAVDGDTGQNAGVFK